MIVVMPGRHSSALFVVASSGSPTMTPSETESAMRITSVSQGYLEWGGDGRVGVGGGGGDGVDDG